jgi:hypothetical protein
LGQGQTAGDEPNECQCSEFRFHLSFLFCSEVEQSRVKG